MSFPPRRLVLVVVVVLLLTAGATLLRHEGAGRTDTDLADGSPQGCGPLRPGDVRGVRPRYLPPRPSPFWSAGSVCEATWLSGRRGRFVPQGIAVVGDTAWVSGYQTRGPRQRPCRVLQVDLRRLRVTRVQTLVAGAVPGREPTYCRHGGALVADGPDRLYLVETMRIWLLDPDRLGRPGAVRRVWRLPDAVKGSTAALGPGREILLGEFRVGRPGRLDRIDLAQLDDPTRAVLTTTRRGQVPAGVQGLGRGRLRDSHRDGLWTVVSHTRCGALLGPRGERLAILPGAEGIAFTRDSLWVVSEASVRIYHDPGDPVVPQLVRYDLDDLAATAGPRSRALARDCLR